MLFFPSVFQDTDGLDFPVLQFADIVAPHERFHQRQQHFADPFRAGEVSVLHVEPKVLHRFWQHTEYLRIGHPIMHHSKHEDANHRLPELPAGSVDDHLQWAFYGKLPEYESCDKVRIKRLFGIIR